MAAASVSRSERQWKKGQRAAATRKMLGAASECIAAIRTAGASHLPQATRDAARQAGELAEQHARALGELPGHAVETWTAAANLLRSVQSLEAVLNAPEEWGGMALAMQALQHLGVVQEKTENARRLATQRANRKGVTRGNTKAERAREIKARLPAASSRVIARVIDSELRAPKKGAEPKETSARALRRVLAKQ